MIKFLVCVVAGLAVSGCATITRGTTNQIQIVSEPSGADVRTSLSQVCVTPCTLQVSRKDEFSLTISKPGYSEENVMVKTQIAGNGAAGFAGNILAGGIVGMGTDAYTGATLEHVPNPVSVTLKPLPPPSAPTPARAAPRSREPAPKAPQS